MAHLASRACDVSPVPGPPRRLPAATIVEPAALDVKPRPPMAMRLGVVRVDSTSAGVGNTASSDGAGTRPRLPDGAPAGAGGRGGGAGPGGPPGTPRGRPPAGGMSPYCTMSARALAAFAFASERAWLPALWASSEPFTSSLASSTIAVARAFSRSPVALAAFASALPIDSLAAFWSVGQLKAKGGPATSPTDKRGTSTSTAILMDEPPVGWDSRKRRLPPATLKGVNYTIFPSTGHLK